MSIIVKTARDNSELFSQTFLEWLPDNLHVFDAFADEALKVRQKGFSHYSARTILHVLRHHSALSETNGEWKINNDHSPYLARLFDLLYPNAAGLWEYRTTRKAIKFGGPVGATA